MAWPYAAGMPNVRGVGSVGSRTTARNATAAGNASKWSAPPLISHGHQL